jgi:membrane-bound lytic murein transglycosylase D
MRVNGIKSARSLRVGGDLMIPMPSAAALKAGRTDPLLERQVARARRAGLQTRAEDEIPVGTQPANASAASGTVKKETVGGKTRVTYGVASGDSLWSIAQKFDCTVADLRNWNEMLSQRTRGLKIGTALTVWPGPKANLPN